jgi:hypothetical protein
MNENNVTQRAIEAEREAVNAVINILLLFLLVLVGYAGGYYIAMREVATHAGTIVSSSQGEQK